MYIYIRRNEEWNNHIYIERERKREERWKIIERIREIYQHRRGTLLRRLNSHTCPNPSYIYTIYIILVSKSRLIRSTHTHIQRERERERDLIDEKRWPLGACDRLHSWVRTSIRDTKDTWQSSHSTDCISTHPVEPVCRYRYEYK